MIKEKELDKLERQHLDVISANSQRLEVYEKQLEALWYKAKQFVQGEFPEKFRKIIQGEIEAVQMKANKSLARRDYALSELKMVDFLRTVKNDKTVDKL